MIVRYLVLADIHSNLESLQAVLRDAGRNGGFDSVLCLGDTVGYGPDPKACIELVRNLDGVCVAGNHDMAVAGILDIGDFNAAAAVATRWTSGVLSKGEATYLRGLPEKTAHDDCTLVHGSPGLPMSEYIFGVRAAQANIDLFDTSCCLFGHTHVPAIFRCVAGSTPRCVQEEVSPGKTTDIRSGRTLINPGGAGQPRDGDPRAAYGILDTASGSMTHYRVSYDITVTQDKMRRCGLPLSLISRLSYGI